MKLIVTFFIILLPFISNAQDTDVIDIQLQLNTLASDEFEGRSAGTEGGKAAADYIVTTLQSYGIKPLFKSYKDAFKLNDEAEGVNIIAQIEGSDDSLKKHPIIIGAHYDHIGLKTSKHKDNIANGANDNASGAVAVLQLAKRLKDKTPLRPILFILFDAEEKGLLGSKHLANRFEELNITPYVIFNIEMIGVPMNRKAKQAYITGYGKSNFVDVFNKEANQEALIYLPTAKKYGLFMRSDNYPFYQKFNIPSHTVSSFDFRNYEYYHHVKDESQLMDAAHMLDLIQIWTPVLEHIANHKNNIITLN